MGGICGTNGSQEINTKIYPNKYKKESLGGGVCVEVT
jgi:hypothetical protein